MTAHHFVLYEIAHNLIVEVVNGCPADSFLHIFFLQHRKKGDVSTLLWGALRGRSIRTKWQAAGKNYNNPFSFCFKKKKKKAVRKWRKHKFFHWNSSANTNVTGCGVLFLTGESASMGGRERGKKIT